MPFIGDLILMVYFPFGMLENLFIDWYRKFIRLEMDHVFLNMDDCVNVLFNIPKKFHPTGISLRLECDEITGDQPRTLVDQLVERVLSVGAGFSPKNGSGGVVHRLPVQRDTLAIALHCQLLKVGRETVQVLFIRQHGNGLRLEEITIPDRQQAHQYRHIPFQRRGTEMFIHLVKTRQHLLKLLRSDGDQR